MQPKSLGQIGYEAYALAANWRTFDGRPMPAWVSDGAGPPPQVARPIPVPLSETDVGRETQRRWEAAADAIVNLQREQKV